MNRIRFYPGQYYDPETGRQRWAVWASNGA